MGKQKKPNNNVTVNRRARFDYTLGEELSCGMELKGPEVRSIRDHHVQLKGSFVTIRNSELFLNNLTLGSEVARNIRLLATKRQILSLSRARQDGYSIIPIRLLAGGRHIKLVIAAGKGKKKYDKRRAIKGRDLDREARRDLK